MDYQTPDSQFNFRLKGALKASFTELCRANQITVSEALVAYMERCVDAEEILGFEKLPTTDASIEKRLADVENQLGNVYSRLVALGLIDNEGK